MIHRKPTLWLAAVLLPFALLRCGSKENKQEEPEKKKYCLDESYKQKGGFVQPVMQQVAEGIPLTGTVEANPDKVVHFMSLVGGIISNTWFSVGDHVKKGQVLAELRSTELSGLQADLKYTDARIKVAEKKLEAARSMFEDGLASRKELQEAESELDILAAEKQKTLSNLALFSASAEKGVFQIKAPASGIITAKAIVPGSQISADSEPLFTISDLNEVWVMVNVYATHVKNIDTGMPVQIKTLSYQDEVFNGKITAISQVYDDEARVLKARVVLPNPGLRLKPGMVVDVNAIRQMQFEALSVPTSSIVFDDNQNYVVVYHSDCDLEIRKVGILSKNNGTTFVSEGLKPNDRLMAENQLLIYEHLKNFQN